jgi:hypothetical protein
MTLRRFAGILMSLLPLQFALGGGDPSCAGHAHGSVTMEAGGEHESHDSHGTSDRTTRAPNCDIPVRPHCCEAFASCTVTFGAALTSRRAQLPATTLAITGVSVRTPTLGLPAPEPPPPKA